jgi:hypothetical protein
VILLYLIVLGPYLFLLAVVMPLLAGAVAVAVAATIAGCYIVGLVRVLITRPANLPAPRWFPKSPADGEPAELSYFYGPAFADVEHVATVAFRLAQDLVTKVFRMVQNLLRGWVTPSRHASQWLTVPLAIALAAGTVGGIALGAIAFAEIAVVHIVIAALLFAAMRVVAILLRAIDTGLLRIKHIRMICPHCYERVTYPEYECSGGGCTRRHKDVRPGHYGIFRRRCRCGTKLPTLLMLGSTQLDAYCPHQGCKRSLEHRPGEAQEIVLPFFGAAGAGKTRLMYGLVTLLRSADGLVAEFADSATTAELSEIKLLLASGRAPTKTTVALPRGQVLRVKSKGGTRLLQLFDGAGERFYRSESTAELGFLTKARTFVLVIDPLSVDHLWATLPSERRKELAAVRSQAPSPELAYQQTHQQMEAMGIRLKKARLAVVFSRADLLEPLHGQRVGDWAQESLGLGNLVRSVRHQFGEIEFFRTASVLEDGGRLHASILELAQWLVTREGITLPGQLNGKIS